MTPPPGRVRLDNSGRMPVDEVEEPRRIGGRRPGRGPAPYVELVARSCFSFLEGASTPDVLVDTALDLQHDTMALTDRDGLYGSVRFLERVKRHVEEGGAALRPVVGALVTVRRGSQGPWHTVAIHVENAQGYRNLCTFLTESHGLYVKGKARSPAEGLPKNLYAGMDVEALARRAEGLWALLMEPYDEGVVAVVREAFGARASLGLVRRKDGLDRARTTNGRVLSARFDLPLCATGDVLFACPPHKPLHDVVHCIREGVTLQQAGRALLLNAEAHLKRPEEMVRLFSDVPEAVARTREVADACTFSLAEVKYRFPCELDDPVLGLDFDDAPPIHGATADDVLREHTEAGALRRYRASTMAQVPEKVRGLLEKELGLVRRKGLAQYFLSVETIVRIAQQKNILCQGRGSAANSAVCFCLGITAVDPAKSELLFERFLSDDRDEPPDIDVDFEHERREEVIQEIYRRYGRHRAAMVSSVVAYRGKSALREVGKVFGFGDEEVDRLSSLVTYWDSVAKLSPERVREAGFDPQDTRVAHVLRLARDIQGYPRHLSVHVGGFVIAFENLVNVAPVEPATMEGRTVIPWDKDDVDVLGFYKMDVLGLGMLTVLRKALDMVQHDERVRADTPNERLAKIPQDDPAVYAALQRADTVGIFQVESRAQMAMLPRLKPQVFYDLVVQVAIVRPGPIHGGMVHPYLKRRSGEEDPDMPHECLRPILERTLGIPIFQEQVMHIAIAGAGYTGSEANKLRRDMAAWRKNGDMERHKERLAKGFAEKGIAQGFADRLYEQIKGFGEYGFPESHAASFANLVYASAWLKVHHPAAFAAALLNSQPMGFYSPSVILQDAERHGVEVRELCVTRSDWDTTLEGWARNDNGDEKLPALRVGLRQVKGLGEAAGRRIEAARWAKPFSSLEDLASRASLNPKELRALAEAGALEVLQPGRRVAMWAVRGRSPQGHEPLFEGVDRGEVLPTLDEMPRVEKLLLDYERKGHSADHPMRVLRPTLPRHVCGSRELDQMPHGRPIVVAGLVVGRQRPQTASGIVFVTLEDEHGFMNVVLYRDLFERQHHVATTSSLLLVRGKSERSRTDAVENGAASYVVATDLVKLELPGAGGAPFSSLSRDFH